MSPSIRKIKKSTKETELSKIIGDGQKRARLVLLILGISLTLFGIVIPKIGAYKREKPQEPVVYDTIVSFAQEPVKVDSSFVTKPAGKTIVRNPPVRIVYPALTIDLPVRQARIIKGYWEVFPDVAGFGSGSSYPDEDGNQVIFAHARSGLFQPLKNAKLGESVFVFTKDKWYQYKISEIKEVLPTQVEVIAPTTEAVLTLYTCSGFSDSKRLIVTAKRIS